MKKKYLTLIAAANIFLFGATYFVYLNKIDVAKVEIKKLEHKEKKQFLKRKQGVQNDFESQNKKHYSLFTDYYNESKAIEVRDTVISFFLYSKKLQIQGYALNYLDCLSTKCGSLITNEYQDSVFEKEFDEIKTEFGDDANEWLGKLGKETFFKYTEDEVCKLYFKDTKAYIFNKSALNEFQTFLVAYKENKKAIVQESKSQLYKYSAKLNRAKKGLSKEAKSLLDREIQSNKPMFNIDKAFTFDGDILGVINYSFSCKSLDEGSLQSAVDYAYKEQYKNNSLYTGATPYSYCYGSNNSSSAYGGSIIKVITGSGSDVLVSIKNDYGKVVRHGYIRAGSSYKFNLSNGRYQVFFYSGKGWNPNKFMKETHCGKLKGGFVSENKITKDYPQSL